MDVAEMVTEKPVAELSCKELLKRLDIALSQLHPIWNEQGKNEKAWALECGKRLARATERAAVQRAGVEALLRWAEAELKKAE